MTKLLKSLKRELVFTNGQSRTVIVELEPGDIISFRVKRKKERFSVSLHSVYQLALVTTMKKKYAERLNEYKAKRKAGYRARKPKPPTLPFGKTILKLA